ncbi:guanylate kinase [Ammoniphilus resinae]|uniref:Guanylate kinase n=1 Tax=Ammoniphilus resinae TaxID=861532 RepID=A0ABS4GLQ8_9BACL|nr:guanylate kinase [Ammoniphilus resinae]MBP1931208.1 guanylate kinase [Ammoniphilus resinae]
MQGRVFLFVGPDGSGRNTLANAMGITFHIPRVVSYTTRPKRQYETPGRDYIFVTEKEFTEKEQAGNFIEAVRSDGYYYGIKKEDCERFLREQGGFYAVLSPAGCEIFKKLFPNVVTIFVYADRDTVTERQQLRGDDKQTIERHLRHYDNVMNYQGECDIAIANYDLASTAQELTTRIENFLGIVHDPDSKY